MTSSPSGINPYAMKVGVSTGTKKPHRTHFDAGSVEHIKGLLRAKGIHVVRNKRDADIVVVPDHVNHAGKTKASRYIKYGEFVKLMHLHTHKGSDEPKGSKAHDGPKAQKALKGRLHPRGDESDDELDKLVREIRTELETTSRTEK